MQEQLGQGGDATTAESIRQHALVRVATIFHKPIDVIELQASFARDLKPSFVSDFRANEYDRILDDVRDVADPQTLEEIREGRLTIVTVDDYCDHMIRCYAKNPAEVALILKLPRVRAASLWKGLLEKLGLSGWSQ